MSKLLPLRCCLSLMLGWSMTACSSKTREPSPAPPSSAPRAAAAPVTAPHPATSAVATPADRKKVDLASVVDQYGNFTGTIEVPTNATFDCGRARGPEDLPVDFCTVIAGPIELRLDEAQRAPGGPPTLAAYKRQQRVAAADVVREQETPGGFTLMWRSGPSTLHVEAWFADLSCGGDVPDAPVLADRAFQICASYVPAPLSASAQPVPAPAVRIAIKVSGPDDTYGAYMFDAGDTLPAVSEDGTRVAVLTSDAVDPSGVNVDTLSVWDIETGREVSSAQSNDPADASDLRRQRLADATRRAAKATALLRGHTWRPAPPNTIKVTPLPDDADARGADLTLTDGRILRLRDGKLTVDGSIVVPDELEAPGVGGAPDLDCAAASSIGSLTVVAAGTTWLLVVPTDIELGPDDCQASVSLPVMIRIKPGAAAAAPQAPARGTPIR